MILIQRLLEDLKELMPNVNHKFCVRHIHANFKNHGHDKKALKDHMWNIAKAYKKNEHKYYTGRINSTSNKAYAFLLNLIQGQ